MEPFTVIYEEPSEPVGWQFFECHADDADHAKEQCINAYPTAVVLCVCKGHMAHEPYYGDDETPLDGETREQEGSCYDPNEIRDSQGRRLG